MWCPEKLKGLIPTRSTLPCSSLSCISLEKSLICSNPNSYPVNPHNFNPNTSSTNQTENGCLCVWVSERLACSTAKVKGRGGSDGTCSAGSHNLGTVNLINCEGGLLDVGCSLDTNSWK